MGVETHTYDDFTTTIDSKRYSENRSMFVPLSESKTLNELGQIIFAVDANSNTTSYTYDPFGNQQTVTDSLTNVITTEFDTWGRQLILDDPNYQKPWEYKYDALDNLRWQKDAKNQELIMSYDVFSRIVSEQDVAGGNTRQWQYYSTTDAEPYRSIGQLKRVWRTSDGFDEYYRYDTLGRVEDQRITLAGILYSTKTAYRINSSLVRKLTYPQTGGAGKIKVHYQYDSGYLTTLAVVDGRNAYKVYWELKALNNEGAISIEALGNTSFGTVLEKTTTYVPETGMPSTISTGAGSIQDVHYGFDSFGNLAWRHDDTQNVSIADTNGVLETFNSAVPG